MDKHQGHTYKELKGRRSCSDFGSCKGKKWPLTDMMTVFKHGGGQATVSNHPMTLAVSLVC